MKFKQCLYCSDNFICADKKARFFYGWVLSFIFILFAASVLYAADSRTIEIDDDPGDTDGIIIINPGQTEPEELERYILQRRRIAPAEDIRDEIDYSGGEAELRIDYEEDDEASVILVDDLDSGRIQRAGYIMVEKAGFISDNFVQDGVLYSKNNKFILTQGDEVYVDITVGRPASEGMFFVIYDDSEEIYSKDGDEFMGNVINIQGHGYIQERISNNRYRAKIKRANTAIKESSKIKMRSDIMNYHRKISNRVKGAGQNVNAEIIKGKENRENIHYKNIVYINAGLNKGIIPGERLEIFVPEADTDEGPVEAYHTAGYLLVINSMRRTSVGMIIKQKQPIKPGYIVRSIRN
ncbi:MAG: hypothetical protein ACLFP1_02335 [Candidatus Goldiibacteriota bacterium]